MTQYQTPGSLTTSLQIAERGGATAPAGYSLSPGRGHPAGHALARGMTPPNALEYATCHNAGFAPGARARRTCEGCLCCITVNGDQSAPQEQSMSRGETMARCRECVPCAGES